MQQELFEELIKDYTTKVVDKYNPAIYEYEVVTFKRKTINSKRPYAGGKYYVTPNGVFKNKTEAAKSMGFKLSTLYQYMSKYPDQYYITTL